MAGNNSLLNSFSNHLVPINIEINIVVDFYPNNSSSNKDKYFFHDFGSLFNYDYYKNNFNGSTISESSPSLIVLIKKGKQQPENKTLIKKICLSILQYSKNKFSNLL